MPPLLFLHGFLGSGQDAPLLPNVLAPDLPGHGTATGLPSADYTMPGAAARLIRLLDEAKIERCIPVGYSMGGRLALFFALAYSERVEKLVLESASPGLRTEAERAARRRLDADRAREIVADFPGFLERWYQMPLFASVPEALRTQWIAARQQHQPEELAQSLEGMGTGSQPSLWERLPELRVPTLAVTGALDLKFTTQAREMAALNPSIQHGIIPAAGHVPHAEQPEAFLTMLRDFLNR